MRSGLILSLAAILGLCGALAWTLSRLASADAQVQEHAAQIATLRAEREDARQQVIAQRALLREQTLTTATRSPDEFLALFPAPFPQGDWRPAESEFEDCWFRSADGLRLHGWLLRHEQPRQVLLVIHGNAGNLTHRAGLASLLSQRYAATVLVFDYRGYGRSEGTPTIPGLLIDARAARKELAARAGIAESDVVLLGESLGGGIAVDLAAENGARGLVLLSTFSSFKEVAAIHYHKILVDALVADRLDSVAKIGQFRGPLLQFHGEADRTIPLALGQKLFAAANEPKTFVAAPGRDHNDRLPEPFFAALDRWLVTLGPIGPGR
jgi:hypothetical protein